MTTHAATEEIQDSNPAKSRARENWIDALRGAAILMVIHFHVVLSMQKFPGYPVIFSEITTIIAPVRMPILVFLSGLFVLASMNKGAWKYFWGKADRILFPFVLWTLIMYALSIAKEVFLDAPFDVSIFESLTTSPLNHLWFLRNLLVYYVAFYIASKVNFLFPLIIGSILYVVFYETGDNGLTSLFVFFSLGGYIGKNVTGFSENISSIPVVWIALPALLSVTFLALNVYNGARYYTYLYSLTALFALPVLVVAFKRAQTTRFSSLLEYFGRNSMIFFLTHVPIITATYVILRKLTSFGAISSYAIMLIASILLGAVIVHMEKRYRTASMLFSARAVFRFFTREKPKNPKSYSTPI